MLPDDALLEVSNRYREDQLYLLTWLWETLVHVYHRWRRIVFASPGHLHLLHACNGNTRTKSSLLIWPPLPLAITCFPWHAENKNGVENITAALGCNHRVSEITIDGIKGLVLKRLAAAMQVRFPALAYLRLSSPKPTTLVLPDTFLGGWTPRLRSFTLLEIHFPAFPQLASSANHILSLCLWDIPDAGYISPVRMAACLAALPYLEAPAIGFLTFRSRLVQTNPPLPTPILLPSLTYFVFRGHRGYLEDLRARVDIPLSISSSLSYYDSYCKVDCAAALVRAALLS